MRLANDVGVNRLSFELFTGSRDLFTSLCVQPASLQNAAHGWREFEQSNLLIHAHCSRCTVRAALRCFCYPVGAKLLGLGLCTALQPAGAEQRDGDTSF